MNNNISVLYVRISNINLHWHHKWNAFTVSVLALGTTASELNINIIFSSSEICRPIMIELQWRGQGVVGILLNFESILTNL